MGYLGDLLRHTIVFQRKAPSRDASGGAVENYVDIPGLGSIPALIQPNRGQAQRNLGQRQVIISHDVYIDDSSAVAAARRGDRIYHAETGRYFLPRGVEDMGGQGQAWRIECSLET